MLVAVYDFDGTLIKKQSVPVMLKVYKQLKFKRCVYLKVWVFIVLRLIAYKLKIFKITKASFRAAAMKDMSLLFAKLSEEERARYTEAIYKTLKESVSEVTLKKLEEDKKRGAHTILLSGGYQEVLMPFQELGFDQVIGTKLMSDGKVLKKNTIEIIIDEKKVEALNATLLGKSVTRIIAYADSIYDLPLLKSVDEGYAVHADEALKQVAKDYNITVL